jgi:hypothetical protein
MKDAALVVAVYPAIDPGVAEPRRQGVDAEAGGRREERGRLSERQRIGNTAGVDDDGDDRVIVSGGACAGFVRRRYVARQLAIERRSPPRSAGKSGQQARNEEPYAKRRAEATRRASAIAGNDGFSPVIYAACRLSPRPGDPRNQGKGSPE